MDKIKITLETLYDILRNEKKREDLQKLDPTFFIDVISYFREKKNFLETKRVDDNLFATGEKEKLEYELRSIKRILKEIYEKREKKIIDIAVNRSRTGSDIIDTSTLLIEEKEFYERVVSILNQFRRDILLTVFKGELPLLTKQMEFVPKTEPKPELNQKSDEEEPLPPQDNPVPEQTKLGIKPRTNPEETASSKFPESSLEPNISSVKIKIIRPIPRFVWKDLKVYGPYDAGEEIMIFPEVAELMIRKNRAERL